MSILTKVLTQLGEAAAKYTRKKTPIEQLRESARWEHNHMGATKEHPIFKCVICGWDDVTDKEKCPGLPAHQEARAKLALLENG